MDSSRQSELFLRHIATVQRTTEEALAVLGLPGLVIAAGDDTHYFDSTVTHHFKANHHFKHWCPDEGSGHAIVTLRRRSLPL